MKCGDSVKTTQNVNATLTRIPLADSLRPSFSPYHVKYSCVCPGIPTFLFSEQNQNMGKMMIPVFIGERSAADV